MKESIVALIGAIRGPWVYTGKFATPVVEVKGAGEHTIVVELSHTPSEDDRFAIHTMRHSRFSMDPARFMRISYKGTGSMPICRISSR